MKRRQALPVHVSWEVRKSPMFIPEKVWKEGPFRKILSHLNRATKWWAATAQRELSNDMELVSLGNSGTEWLLKALKKK